MNSNAENGMKPCPVCTSENIKKFFDLVNIPVHCNILLQNRDEAINVQHVDMQLGICQNCAHIFNVTFDSSLMSYTQAYENSLYFSPHFQSYADSLANLLMNRYHLYQKTIIEIGSGKGDFLKQICKLGNNTGFGFDPSYVSETNNEDKNENITFIQEFYSEKYNGLEVDFIYSRHVLEHVEYPSKMIQIIRETIGDRLNVPIFFEVPNCQYILNNLAIWDVIYEHISYFTVPSISYLLTNNGFHVIDIKEEFGKQYLTIHALPVHNNETNNNMSERINEISVLVDAFAKKVDLKMKKWQDDLQTFFSKNNRLIIWGAGSKGVTFLNLLKLKNQIQYAVDINPRKQGKFVAGTGQKIVSPNFLQQYRPQGIIIMNPIYVNEIRKTLDKLNCSAQILIV